MDNNINSVVATIDGGRVSGRVMGAAQVNRKSTFRDGTFPRVAVKESHYGKNVLAGVKVCKVAVK